MEVKEEGRARTEAVATQLLKVANTTGSAMVWLS